MKITQYFKDWCTAGFLCVICFIVFVVLLVDVHYYQLKLSQCIVKLQHLPSPTEVCEANLHLNKGE